MSADLQNLILAWKASSTQEIYNLLKLGLENISIDLTSAWQQMELYFWKVRSFTFLKQTNKNLRLLLVYEFIKATWTYSDTSAINEGGKYLNNVYHVRYMTGSSNTIRL